MGQNKFLDNNFFHKLEFSKNETAATAAKSSLKQSLLFPVMIYVYLILLFYDMTNKINISVHVSHTKISPLGPTADWATLAFSRTWRLLQIPRSNNPTIFFLTWYYIFFIIKFVVRKDSAGFGLGRRLTWKSICLYCRLECRSLI
jgi:hypothetical protein